MPTPQEIRRVGKPGAGTADRMLFISARLLQALSNGPFEKIILPIHLRERILGTESGHSGRDVQGSGRDSAGQRQD